MTREMLETTEKQVTVSVSEAMHKGYATQVKELEAASQTRLGLLQQTIQNIMRDLGSEQAKIRTLELVACPNCYPELHWNLVE